MDIAGDCGTNHSRGNFSGVKIRGSIAALAVLVSLGSPAYAMGWYDSVCCSNRDCEELADTAVTIQSGGYRVRYKAKMGLDVDVIVPFDKARPSRDEHYHGCANTTAFLCLYVPVNA